ncbi:hypothetical protein ACVXG7_29510 [Enterobacter hormaechei]
MQQRNGFWRQGWGRILGSLRVEENAMGLSSATGWRRQWLTAAFLGWKLSRRLPFCRPDVAVAASKSSQKAENQPARRRARNRTPLAKLVRG